MAEDREKFFKLIGIKLPSKDPTLPYDNYFLLMGIDESLPDGQVAKQVVDRFHSRMKQIQEARLVAETESGQVLSKLTRYKDALKDSAKISKLRQEMRGKRIAALEKKTQEYFALKVPRKRAHAELKREAGEIGFAVGDAGGAVDETMRKAGNWPTETPPPPGKGPGPGPGTGQAKPAQPGWLAPIVVMLSLTIAITLFSVVAWWLGLAFGLLAAGTILGGAYWNARRHGHTHPELPWLGSGLASLGMSIGMPLAVSALQPVAPIPNGPVQPGETVSAAPLREIQLSVDLPESVPIEPFLANPHVLTFRDDDRLADHLPDAAVDGQMDSYWRVGAGSSNELTLRFNQDRLLDGLLVLNGAPDDAKLGRVRRLQVTVAGQAPIALEMQDHPVWQLHPFPANKTTKVTIKVLDNHGTAATPAGIRELWFVHGAGLEPADANWRGNWNSDNVGPIQLTQRHNWIVGSYSNDVGVILGRATGTRVEGTSIYAPEGESMQVNGLRLQLQSHGLGFDGKWKSGSMGEWQDDGFWSGEKVN